MATPFSDRVENLFKDSDVQDWDGELKFLLEEFSDIFSTTSANPIKVEPIHVDIKEEFQNKVFYRPEPIRSDKEQKIIDDNARKLISLGKAKTNPHSVHNLGQVIVNRKDKDGRVLHGREKVCLDCRPVNKAFKNFKHRVPNIQRILRKVCKVKILSELDLS